MRLGCTDGSGGRRSHVSIAQGAARKQASYLSFRLHECFRCCVEPCTPNKRSLDADLVGGLADADDCPAIVRLARFFESQDAESQVGKMAQQTSHLQLSFEKPFLSRICGLIVVPEGARVCDTARFP